ncbi:hypothetical protein NS201_10870 [Pseudomonas oryzihabitans]|nr:hypothetical protein NS201_10870 [Pseudomonas psychrotolerans]
MADLTLPEVIARFRGNEARIADLTNGNSSGYYTTVDGKKVETLPSVVSRLTSAIAAASATAETFKSTSGAKLIGFGSTTVDATLTAQAKSIADNTKAISDQDAAKLSKTGGTLTGPLTLAGAPTDSLHAATKGWAENLVGSMRPAIGDLMTTSGPAPSTDWIPDSANYLQSSYPALFAKLGLLNSDNSAGTYTLITSALLKTGAGTGSQAFLASANGVFITYDYNSGRILRSTDNGTTLAPITNTQGGTPCALTTDGKGVWMFGNAIAVNTKHLMRSTDDGLTWGAVSLPVTDSWATMTLATDSKGTWIACGDLGWYFRSTDNGATWARISPPSQMRWATYAGGSTWYAIIPGTQFTKSVDNGLTWTQLPQPLYTGTYTVNMWGLSFSGGILALTGYTNIGGGNFNVVGLSVDGVNWRWFSLGSGSGCGPVVFGRDNVAVCPCYTGGIYRWTMSLDPLQTSGVAATNPTAFNALVTWPVAVCTDGMSSWYAASSNSDGMARNLPAYDVKTLFRVPKSATLGAPFTSYIKAK